MSMSQAVTTVWGDGALASSSAPSCLSAIVAAMTHGEDFVGNVLLETDATRGRPGIMGGLVLAHTNLFSEHEPFCLKTQQL